MLYSVTLNITGHRGYIMDGKDGEDAKNKILDAFSHEQHNDLMEPDIELSEAEELPFPEKNGLKTYDISAVVTGRFEICVTAECQEEAEELAREAAFGADFGDICDINIELMDISEELSFEEELE